MSATAKMMQLLRETASITTTTSEVRTAATVVKKINFRQNIVVDWLRASKNSTVSTTIVEVAFGNSSTAVEAFSNSSTVVAAFGTNFATVVATFGINFTAGNFKKIEDSVISRTITILSIQHLVVAVKITVAV